MAIKYNKPALPTLIITIDPETRLINTRVERWEGVSAGMMAGIDYSIQKAVHQYHLAGITKEHQATIAASAAALREQSGTGRVDPHTSDIPN